jgi:PadR family transcriptional regulator AphA
MSRTLTPFSYVVLALVGRDGAAPHDLVRMTRGGQRLYYAGAASKIYEQPKRLERLGYLRSEKRPGKTRERTYYTLTTKGVAALREWLARPSSFPRIQSEAVARVLASDVAEDERVVAESLQALRHEIEQLAAVIDEDERRAPSIPHRARQLKLVRSLGRRLLQTHLEWIDEVERELGGPAEVRRDASSHRQGTDPSVPPSTTGSSDAA